MRGVSNKHCLLTFFIILSLVINNCISIDYHVVAYPVLRQQKNAPVRLLCRDHHHVDSVELYCLYVCFKNRTDLWDASSV